MAVKDVTQHLFPLPGWCDTVALRGEGLRQTIRGSFLTAGLIRQRNELSRKWVKLHHSSYLKLDKALRSEDSPAQPPHKARSLGGSSPSPHLVLRLSSFSVFES